MARILLGVSGGIAAYKAIELARLATRAGHGVRVLMTPSATRFVGAATFEGIAGSPVLIEEFDRDPARGTYPGEPAPEHDPISHLELAARADAMIVAPASANTIAKLAAGICDSMLTTSFLACTAPRIVAPAMNDRMYDNAATRDNIETLRAPRRDGDRARDRPARLARRVRHGAAAGAGAAARRRRGVAAGADRALGWARGAGHRRWHPRGDRPGALHRQPLERQDGLRAGRRRGAPRSRGQADRCQRLAADSDRRSSAST